MLKLSHDFVYNYLILNHFLVPNLKPIPDLDHPISITNNSAIIYWKINLMNCTIINGIYKKIYLELKVNISKFYILIHYYKIL